MTGHDAVDEEQRHLGRLLDRLEELRADTRARLDAVLRARGELLRRDRSGSRSRGSIRRSWRRSTPPTWACTSVGWTWRTERSGGSGAWD